MSINKILTTNDFPDVSINKIQILTFPIMVNVRTERTILSKKSLVLYSFMLNKSLVLYSFMLVFFHAK